MAENTTFTDSNLVRPTSDVPLTKRRCRNCRFWGEKPDFYWLPSHRPCNCPKVVDVGQGAENLPIDGLLVGGDYGIILSTGSEYGCVHWENRPDAQGVVNKKGQTT